MVPIIIIFFLIHCVGALPVQHGEDFDVEFDWRDKGVISPVVNQGEMGNSMVFGKTEAVESMYAIAHNKLVELSFNMVADCCNNNEPDFGCIAKHGGLCSASDYGTAKGFCPPHINCTRYGDISRTETLPTHNETAMKMVTRTIGPPLAYIYAGAPSFQMYSSGIYADPDCKGPPDHVIQIVGYGKDTTSGTNFWIIKNTWGSNWGIGGYMYLERDTNQCGISNHVFLPVHGKAKGEYGHTNNVGSFDLLLE